MHSKSRVDSHIVSLSLVLLAGWSVSCAVAVDENNDHDGSDGIVQAHKDQVAQVISVGELAAESESGSALIDLQIAEFGYLVEPDVDLAQVDVICPTGRMFQLDQWLASMDISVPNADGDGSGSLFLFSSGRVDDGYDPSADKRAPYCVLPDCYLHSESGGSWSCICF